MKKSLLLSVAMLGLAGLAGCADTPPPPPPVAEAPPPPPPPVGTTVMYSCSHGDGDLTALYVPGSPETVQLSHADQTMTATRVATKGRSMVYRGDGVSVRRTGRNVIVGMADKHVLTCRAKA